MDDTSTRTFATDSDRRRFSIALFPASATADAKRLVWAKGLRAIGDGYVSILLPAYLLQAGYSAFAIGVVATAALLGSSAFTLGVGAAVARFGYRRSLLAASALMVLTGLGFAGTQAFWPLLLIAFVGTLNPSGGDVSVFLPLEQSLLTQSVGDQDRTALFARYSVVGSLLGAFGTLLAVIPDWGGARFGLAPVLLMQAMFVLYAAIGLAAALLYSRIAEPRDAPRQARQTLGPSRRMVYRMAALFSVDSFGGGFLAQAILAVWLLQSFEMPLASAAAVFFWSNLLSAVSQLAAVPIARRCGLVNTMVFTHLPSSLCVLAMPFMSDLDWVIGLWLLRSLLSQMDVPTRNSYVMAVVTPAERPAAASLTSVPRSLASAVSPAIAGWLLTVSGFAWPLLIGAGLKISYDLALLAMFRRVRPPEEIAGD